ncbi:MAG: FlgD immunoglobulin-like domain containing protein [bacterium]
MNKSIFFALFSSLLFINVTIHGWVIEYPYDAVIVTADRPDGVVVPSRQMILRAKLAYDLHNKTQSRYYIITGKLGSGKTPLTDGIYTNLKAPGDSGYATWMTEWKRVAETGRYGDERIPGGAMLFIMLKSWGIDAPFIILVDDPAVVGSVCVEKGFNNIAVMGNGSGPESDALSSLSARDLSCTTIPDYENGDSVYQWIVDSSWVQPFNARERGIPMDIDVVFQLGWGGRGGYGGPEDNSFDINGNKVFVNGNLWDPPSPFSRINPCMVSLTRSSRTVNNFKQRNCKILAVTGGNPAKIGNGEVCAIQAIAHGIPPEKIFVDRWSGSSGTNCIAAYNMMKEKGYSTVIYTSLNGKYINVDSCKVENGGIISAAYEVAYQSGPAPLKMLGPLYIDEMISITQLKYGDIGIKPYWGRLVGGWVDVGEKLLLDYQYENNSGFLYNLDSDAGIYLENAVTGESFEITDIESYNLMPLGGYIYQRMELELYTPDSLPQGVYDMVFVNADGYPGYHRAVLGVGDRSQVDLNKLYRSIYFYDFINNPVQVLWNRRSPAIAGISLDVFPNPFRGKINLAVSCGQEAASECPVINIFNAKGTLVRKLTAHYSLLTSAVTWDGRDNRGRQLSSGNYYVTVKNGAVETIRRFTIIK